MLAVSREDRWTHLLTAAFLLEEGGAPSDAAERAGHALGLIESALEVFPPGLDPVEDYEGYAVRRLLLALRMRLSS
jgi:hypothetical protein